MQGNPTSYLGHTLTWEKGRQLKSFDNTQYTYNANGICTSKTVNGIVHTFVLDGIKILKESWAATPLSRCMTTKIMFAVSSTTMYHTISSRTCRVM